MISIPQESPYSIYYIQAILNSKMLEWYSCCVARNFQTTSKSLNERGYLAQFLRDSELKVVDRLFLFYGIFSTAIKEQHISDFIVA